MTERLGLEDVLANQFGSDARRYARMAGEQALAAGLEVLYLTVPMDLPFVRNELSISVRYPGGGIANQIFEGGNYAVPAAWIMSGRCWSGMALRSSSSWHRAWKC